MKTGDPGWNKGVMVLGTGTGVGKTVFSAYLIRQLMDSGHSVVPIKPVCSGGMEDVRILCDAARNRFTPDQVNPWRYDLPITPMLAARRSGRPLTSRSLVASLENRLKLAEHPVVESAGGPLSPIAEDYNNLDLAVELKMSCVLVALNRLGVISEVLLVLSELKRRSLECRGVILNTPVVGDESVDSNAEMIREFAHGTRVEMLPWLGENPCSEMLFGVNEKKVKKGVELVGLID